MIVSGLSGNCAYGQLPRRCCHRQSTIQGGLSWAEGCHYSEDRWRTISETYLYWKLNSVWSSNYIIYVSWVRRDKENILLKCSEQASEEKGGARSKDNMDVAAERTGWHSHGTPESRLHLAFRIQWKQICRQLPALPKSLQSINHPMTGRGGGLVSGPTTCWLYSLVFRASRMIVTFVASNYMPRREKYSCTVARDPEAIVVGRVGR